MSNELVTKNAGVFFFNQMVSDLSVQNSNLLYENEVTSEISRNAKNYMDAISEMDPEIIAAVKLKVDEVNRRTEIDVLQKDLSRDIASLEQSIDAVMRTSEILKKNYGVVLSEAQVDRIENIILKFKLPSA
jgi:hypothetical protein